MWSRARFPANPQSRDWGITIFKIKAMLACSHATPPRMLGSRLVGTHGQALSTAVCQDGMLGCLGVRLRGWTVQREA